jgi:hypothetical protein
VRQIEISLGGKRPFAFKSSFSLPYGKLKNEECGMMNDEESVPTIAFPTPFVSLRPTTTQTRRCNSAPCSAQAASLQSPDDPENPVQLITNVQTASNNLDDSQLLAQAAR